MALLLAAILAQIDAHAAAVIEQQLSQCSVVHDRDEREQLEASRHLRTVSHQMPSSELLSSTSTEQLRAAVPVSRIVASDERGSESRTMISCAFFCRNAHHGCIIGHLFAIISLIQSKSFNSRVQDQGTAVP